MKILDLIEEIEQANLAGDKTRKYSLCLADDKMECRLQSNLSGVMKAAYLQRANVCSNLRLNVNLFDFINQDGFKELELPNWEDYFNFLQFRMVNCAILTNREFNGFMMKKAAEESLGKLEVKKLSVYDILSASFKFQMFELKAIENQVSVWLYDDESEQAVRTQFNCHQAESSSDMAVLLRRQKINTPELRQFVKELYKAQPENKIFQKMV